MTDDDDDIAMNDEEVRARTKRILKEVVGLSVQLTLKSEQLSILLDQLDKESM